jgi:hypothetical protein
MPVRNHSVVQLGQHGIVEPQAVERNNCCTNACVSVGPYLIMTARAQSETLIKPGKCPYGVQGSHEVNVFHQRNVRITTDVMEGLPGAEYATIAAPHAHRLADGAQESPSCPCHVSIWCAMGAVWRRTAACAGPSFPRPASKGGRTRRRTRGRRAGAGHDCSSASLDRILARCPFCQQGALRIIAAIMQGEVIRKILRHLNSQPPPPDCSGASPPESLCVVLRLRVPDPSPASRRLVLRL